ncbi:MAG TPA: VIT family protein [Propionibacteriaceae bacterium]|nr:VIT family protein [Propionibacteriaceae bacterium]
MTDARRTDDSTTRTGSAAGSQEVVDDELQAMIDHAGEGHSKHSGARLNWLRAGVLGANDGIVSMSGLVIGVAAAGATSATILTAGLAGIAAGALSMAAGEYVSVSTQRDTEMALIAKERQELAEFPEEELRELAGLYVQKGLTAQLALEVATQLHAHDALAAHAETELGIDHEEFTSPWHAALASMISFLVGSIIPTLTIVLIHGTVGMVATVVAAGLALLLTGYISAALGEARRGRAMARNVIWGLAAMAVTYGIGAAVGTRV